jgi:HemY protein
MRLLIKLLLVLAASVAVVTLLGEGPGYVLVQVGGYTLETTAALAALALILLLAVGWEVWGMLAAAWHLPAAFGQARERRHQRQSLEALEEGVLALERGEAQRARKLFARGARHAKAPAAFFMEAARAAHMAGDDERAEAFLARAQQGGREEGAATLLRAEIEMDAGRGEHALALLSDLEKQESDNPRVIQRLLQLHREAEDWAALLELLPRAKQAGVLDAAEMEDELRRVRGRRMEQARLEGDGAAVEALWKSLDRDERTRPAQLGPWVHYLVGEGRRDEAEKALDQGLRRHWQGELVELYLALPEAPGSAQGLLNRLEKWLGDHPRDPHLLAVLAQLAVGAQLWGKADHYLEEARNLDEVPAGVLLRLASIYQERGAADQALACLRRGLSAWQGTAAALPVPFTASNR